MPRLPSMKAFGGGSRNSSGPVVSPGNRPNNRPSALDYFYGRITRAEAELFLQERGGHEGLFLLRESISPMGNYAISICHANK